MDRRSFLTGAASLATLAGVRNADALTQAEKELLLGGVGAPASAFGRALIGTAIESCIYKNIINGASQIQCGSATYNYLPFMDSNGYPNLNGGAPAQVISYGCHLPSDIVANSSPGANDGTELTLSWTGQANRSGNFGCMGIGLSAPGASLASGGDPDSLIGPSSLLTTGVSVRQTVGRPSGGKVRFFLNYLPTSFNFSFNSGTYVSLGDLVLCRSSDWASLVNTTTFALSIANPIDLIRTEFINVYKALKPGILRPMGWTDPNDNNNVSQHRYRPSWQTNVWLGGGPQLGRWVPSCICGDNGSGTSVITGTDTYSAAAATDTPAAYTDGEVIQGFVLNSNTSTTPTLDVGGRGAKTIISINGGAVANSGSGTSRVLANTPATLIYDAWRDAWVYTQLGMTCNVPLEIQVAVANAVNCNFWYNFPTHVTWQNSTMEGGSNSVAQIVGYVRDNLTCKLYTEFSNEIWNTTFAQSSWAGGMGSFMGFPAANNEQVYGFYALKLAQLWPIVKTAWTTSRNASDLKRVNAFQAVGTISAVQTYRFNGTDLDTTKGYTNYNSKIGQSFNVFPNRPIDVCEIVSYAPYWSGGQIQQFDTIYVPSFNGNGTAAVNITSVTVGNPTAFTTATDAYATGNRVQFSSSVGGVAVLANAFATITRVGAGSYTVAIDSTGATYTSGGQLKQTLVISGLVAAADDYASGNPSQMTSALAWVDNDLRAGTCVAVTPLTLSYYDVNVYPYWEAIMAGYDAQRAGGGLPSLKAAMYEGGLGGIPPSIASCTSLGISTTYGGTGGLIDNLIRAYRNSSLAYAITMAFYQQFMGTYQGDANFGLLPHSQTPGWLLVPGYNAWSLSTGDSLAAKLKTWDANVDYNHGIG